MAFLRPLNHRSISVNQNISSLRDSIFVFLFFLPTLNTGTSPILTISAKSLTGTIANQNKVYGQDDPSVAGIGVTLNGIINNNAI